LSRTSTSSAGQQPENITLEPNGTPSDVRLCPSGGQGHPPGQDHRPRHTARPPQAPPPPRASSGLPTNPVRELASTLGGTPIGNLGINRTGRPTGAPCRTPGSSTASRSTRTGALFTVDSLWHGVEGVAAHREARSGPAARTCSRRRRRLRRDGLKVHDGSVWVSNSSRGRCCASRYCPMQRGRAVGGAPGWPASTTLLHRRGNTVWRAARAQP